MKKWIIQGLAGEYDTVYKCPECDLCWIESADGTLNNIHKHTCKCGFHEVSEHDEYVQEAWQREAAYGGGLTWVHVHEDDIEHYRSKGQRIRALYVKKEDL